MDDARALEAIRRRIEAAENAFDAGVFDEVIADDVVVMVPDYPVQEGRAAAGEFVRGITAWMCENLDRHITYTSAEVRVLGDLAIDRGTFAFRAAFKDGHDPASVTGKYLWLYRRDQAGAWKMWRMIVSRDDNEQGEEPWS